MPAADRARRWRAAHPGSDRRRRSGDRHRPRRRVSKAPARVAPFIGCDGEGCGTDSLGRQEYRLFRIGERELYTGDPLGTAELLDFICDAPPAGKAVLVGFSFGYDVTMILRDLPAERRERLLRPMDPAEAGPGRSRYTFWQDHGIEYLPRNYLRVCRLERLPDGRRRAIAGSARTIYEVFGFFQASFLRTLANWQVGAEYLDLIERNKAARSSFERITPEIREYCAVECRCLAEMMERFRACCHAAGIRPRSWSGAGKLAAALHAEHRTITRAEIAGLVPPGVLSDAQAAYYGGRFEVTRIGAVAGPIYEYDLNSAYPAALRRLPCLRHGRWHECSGDDLARLGPDALFVADVQFRHRPGQLYGLPVRGRGGVIFWPREANGTYWSPELRSAERLGAVIRYKRGWRYECACDCKPFDWVCELYEYRKKIGKKTEGYPIKLGINSLYGKLAQRVGNPRWGNLIWAGLVTALTRAALNDAISLAPDRIVMLATDAVYSLAPLGLPVSDRLGDYEHAEHASMFVVQPGLYWGPPKPKTRGIPLKFFESRTEQFEQAWRGWLSDKPPGAPYPKVVIDMPMFVGMKLAQVRGSPDASGRWVRQQRAISFDWRGKRSARCRREGDSVVTGPLPGSGGLTSMSYATRSEQFDEFDISRLELDEQPDYVELSAPWKD